MPREFEQRHQRPNEDKSIDFIIRETKRRVERIMIQTEKKRRQNQTQNRLRLLKMCPDGYICPNRQCKLKHLDPSSGDCDLQRLRCFDCKEPVYITRNTEGKEIWYESLRQGEKPAQEHRCIVEHGEVELGEVATPLIRYKWVRTPRTIDGIPLPIKKQFHRIVIE